MISSDEEKRNLTLKDRWEAFREDAAKINWRKLAFRKETYSYATVGFELTWINGLGIGLGLGSLDLWVGFPRKPEKLHYKGCGHKVPRQTPRSKEPVKV